MVVPLHFLALKAQLVVLVSAFVIISSLQFGQFLVCCSFTQPFVKVGSTCPPCPMESASLLTTDLAVWTVSITKFYIIYFLHNYFCYGFTFFYFKTVF